MLSLEIPYMNSLSKEPLSMDEFKSMLKKNSLKATSQRMAVHEAMLSLGHACADQVCEWISAKGKTTFTVASVYNILSQMSQLGIYSRRFSSNNKMYFDVNTFTHIHLYDTTNNEFKDFMDEELTDMIESRIRNRRYRGFKVDGFDLQILCHPTTKKNIAK